MSLDHEQISVPDEAGAPPAGGRAPVTPLAGPYQPPPQPAQPLLALDGVPGGGVGRVAYQLAHRLTDQHGGGTAHPVVHLVPDFVRDWPAMATTHARPLPQLARQIAGLLNASDTIRGHLDTGAVIANRWTSSLLACHAAASGATIEQAQAVLDPVRGYLAKPTRTVYLMTSAESLRRRLGARPDLTPFTQGLLHVRGRLEQVQNHFAELAGADPTSVRLDTDGRSPEELAGEIIRALEARPAEMALQT